MLGLDSPSHTWSRKSATGCAIEKFNFLKWKGCRETSKDRHGIFGVAEGIFLCFRQPRNYFVGGRNLIQNLWSFFLQLCGKNWVIYCFLHVVTSFTVYSVYYRYQTRHLLPTEMYENSWSSQMHITEILEVNWNQPPLCTLSFSSTNPALNSNGLNSMFACAQAICLKICNCK